mgnify:CR=1 FL=1
MTLVTRRFRLHGGQLVRTTTTGGQDGSSLDVVVRSDPEVCGLSGSGYHLTLHHSGYGDCTVGQLTLIDCPNELVLIEFERWMRGAGHQFVP